MAIPKVFVSSTCYDLKEVRDNLYEFIDSIGFHPVFSDKNDVFYHPDLHTHDSCIKEIQSCQLFILIIGGRFGGNYKYDIDRSIVNAEYQSAKELKIPMITFVTKDIWSNHLLYKKNSKNKLQDQIEYPAISNQEYAGKIFQFIDEVRLSNNNNAIFDFEFTRDLKEVIKKQYAGMFYDFLWERKNSIEQQQTNTLLANLTTISEKTEEIIKNIYRTVEPNKSDKIIQDLENEVLAKKFWIAIIHQLHIGLRNRTEDELQDFVRINDSDSWYEYVCDKMIPIEISSYAKEGRNFTVIKNSDSEKSFAINWPDDENFNINEKVLKVIETGFEAFKSLDVEGRIEIIKEITYLDN